MFNLERFEQAIATGPTPSAQALSDFLINEVRTFVGDIELSDDMTLVVIKV